MIANLQRKEVYPATACSNRISPPSAARLVRGSKGRQVCVRPVNFRENGSEAQQAQGIDLAAKKAATKITVFSSGKPRTARGLGCGTGAAALCATCICSVFWRCTLCTAPRSGALWAGGALTAKRRLAVHFVHRSAKRCPLGRRSILRVYNRLALYVEPGGRCRPCTGLSAVVVSHVPWGASSASRVCRCVAEDLVSSLG
jgi:hypothetical protein